MKDKNLRRLALSAIVCLTAINAHAEIDLSDQRVRFWQFFNPDSSQFVPDITGPATLPEDYSAPPEGLVRLFQAPRSLEEYPIDPTLTVNGGSVLQSALGIYTFDGSDGDISSEIYVDGAGSRIEIGSGSAKTGNIFLRGKGNFNITDGAVVNWTELNICDGGFGVCDILIGRSPTSNTGIRVIGDGSKLDASNTGGRLFVGADPKPGGWDPAENIDDTTDFLIAQDGGLIHSSGGSVALGFEGAAGAWDADTIGYVRGTVLVDNGTWLTQVLNIGEGDGGSGNVFVVRGGILDITTDDPDAGGFYLGQTGDGVPTEGGSISNLMVVDGPGSTMNADSNSGVVAASRIANGFVTVQNGGAVQLDSTFLLVSGKTGATLSDFNTGMAADVGIATDISNINLDVLSGGSITITDTDLDPISVGALIIGQTPFSAPTQSASVRVSGAGSNITVDNTSKIPLAATQFTIPSVSNIGTGSLIVEDGGAVNFINDDFVIAARDFDLANVSVTDATLTADRVIVGWTDYVAGGATPSESNGVLTLNNGIVEGDVVVDDNGTLNGIGAINGDLIGHGGVISVGLSPGTITVKSLVLGLGTKLIMEVGLNPDGSINAAASDAIVATSGGLDLSAGEVTFELSSVDPNTSLDEILGTAEVLSVEELFESSEEVVLATYNVTDPTGTLSDEELDQRIEVLSFEKNACKKDGWEDLYRTDATIFDNQGDCIQYVNTGE